MDECVQRLVDAVAKSIVENILAQPGDESVQESITTKLEKSYDHTVLAALIHERLEGLSTLMVEQIIQHAKDQAIEILPARISEQEAEATLPPKQNTASIFLSQLNGGGGLLDSFITWEMIQEKETTNDDKIERLKAIQYVDDILPDWDNDIRPFLAQFESLQVCTLYRTWFDKARATKTSDSQALQKDLASDLFKMSVSGTSSFEVSCTSLRYAIEIFIDLVDRSMPDCFLVGELLWQIVLEKPRDLLHVVVDSDPYATSFSLWFSSNEMTVDKILELLAGTTTSVEGVHATVEVLLDLCFASDSSSTQFYFLMELLHSTINCTRVVKFPWELLKERDLTDVFGLFLSGASNASDNRHLSICIDALDILEKGIRDERQRLCCRDHCRVVTDQLLKTSEANKRLLFSLSNTLNLLDKVP